MPFRHRLPTLPPMARKCIAFALLLLGLPCASPAWAGDSGIASRAQRVEAVALQMPRPDDLAFAQAMQRAYVSAFGGIDDTARLREESDADLRLHWQAVESAAFYSDHGGLIDAAQRIFAELERRGLADTKATNRMFGFLLEVRRFDAARAFVSAHPDAGLPSLPVFVDAPTGDLPSVWRFDADGGKAERVGIDLRPLQIIVVAGCHFSADAATDIARDPQLGPVFARHARWLSLSPGSEKLDALAEWNRTHPSTPMLPIHDRAEWALITQWTMPTFAVIKDGKLIGSTKGWRSDDSEFREQLVALLLRTGLLEAGTPR